MRGSRDRQETGVCSRTPSTLPCQPRVSDRKKSRIHCNPEGPASVYERDNLSCLYVVSGRRSTMGEAHGMKLQVVLRKSEEGGYTVFVPALPGCLSEGDTREEALANVREAIELYLEPIDDDRDFGDDIEVLDVAV